MSGTASEETADHSASGPDPVEPVTLDDVSPEQALRAAKPPVGYGFSPVVGQLVAVLLFAVGVLGIQEAIQRMGLVTTSWTSWLLTRVDHRSMSFALLILCVVLVLIGLALLVVVFRPRPRRAVSLTATTGVYLRTADLARLARSRVDGADGVTDVSASATRRRLTMRVSTVSPAAANVDLNDDVEQRVRPIYDALDSAPRLVVTIDNQDLS